MYLKTVLISILFATLWSLNATGRDSVAVQSLKAELKVIVSPRDSIRVLTDLYDLSERKDKAAIAWSIFNVAERTNNYPVAMDMLRQLSNCYIANDTMLTVLENHVRRFPASPDQKETLLFIQMQHISTLARYGSEAQRVENIHDLLVAEAAGRDTVPDIYDDILQCYSLCAYLGYTTKSVPASYLNRMHTLIDGLPVESIALRSFFYTQKAMIYTYFNDHDKAVAADKELLNIIDELEEMYRNKGRIYRDYSTSRYICYRRILSNYPALSDKEVEYYYNKVQEQTFRNPDTEAAFVRQQQPTMYYLLAKKKHAEALPLIKKQFSSKISNPCRVQFLNYMYEAAQACNDTASLVYALTELNSHLKDIKKNLTAENYSELQVRYDILDINAANTRQELELTQDSLDLTGKMLTAFILLSIALAVILIFNIATLRKLKKSILDNRQNTHA